MNEIGPIIATFAAFITAYAAIATVLLARSPTRREFNAHLSEDTERMKRIDDSLSELRGFILHNQRNRRME